MAESKVGIFGFVEKNHHWNPISTKICVNRAKSALMREMGKRVDITIKTSECAGWTGGKYQPGGACTSALGQWATRVVGKDEDPEKLGRWSTLRIQIKSAVISMITAYWICKIRVNLDTNTSYSQQWKEIATRISKKVDLRVKTLIDLNKYVKKGTEEKREVIIMMDANKNTECRTEEMMTMIQECGLVDTHLIANLYATVETYVSGEGDFVVTTLKVQLCVKYTEVTSYNEWIVLDRRALAIDLNHKVFEMENLAICW